MRFLIVDDNEDICHLACRILGFYGKCDYALGGQEAINTVIAHWDNGTPFTGIFLDIMMPDKDGIDTLKEIRKMEHEGANHGYDNIKIIMLTASNSPEHLVRSFKEQSDGYIVKPFNEDALLKEMKKIGLLK